MMPPPIPSAGAVLSLSIVTNRDCVWSARSDVEWVTVDPPSGQGESAVAVVVGANPEGRTRSGHLLVNDQPFSLIQEPSPCRFEVAPRQVSMPHQGGRAHIEVATLPGCVWQVSVRAQWVRVIDGPRGESNGAVELAADGNAGSSRTGEIQIAGVGVSISQPAGPGDRSQCRFSLDSGSANFGAGGGEGSVEVHTVSGCVWGAVSTQPWIIVTSGSHATATATVTYTVQRNLSGVRREGAILAGGRRHVVRQAAQ
jgi:hypothetical protein